MFEKAGLVIAVIAGLLELFMQSLVVQRKANQAMFIVAERTAGNSSSGGNGTRMPPQHTALLCSARHGKGQFSTIRCLCTVGCVLSVQVKEA